MKKFLPLLLSLLVPACSHTGGESPRVVNIINFIRELEPRPGREAITPEVLYRTVLNEAEDLREKDLPGTWLLQYDALIDPAYQALMKEEKARGCDIGAWWEITQPHVEAAGYAWRGRFPWDWYANAGFSVGYTAAERERLCDVFMEKFREVFGEYPKSVGSWMIDAGTMAYMVERYGIEACCICRDQIGTDGYTLWGGYWNGAYYPSRENAYMPAQTPEGAIPLPVFRMLGSDPFDQYDAGVGGVRQDAVTMEPVYPHCGGSPQWADWYLRMFSREPHLAYNYVQIGQENSFTWQRFGTALRHQTARVAQLRAEGKLRVETLLQSGRAFRKRYPSLTPPSSVVATEDPSGEGRKTFWFNCRRYRANLLWDEGGLRFRDIHLFDQSLRSEYLDHPDTLPVFRYETLPMVDGVLWSSEEAMAGLHFVIPGFEGGMPTFRILPGERGQQILWSSSGGGLQLTFTETGIAIRARGIPDGWYLELSVWPGADLPFTAITNRTVSARYLGTDYAVSLRRGTFEPLGEQGRILRILPEKGRIEIEI